MRFKYKFHEKDEEKIIHSLSMDMAIRMLKQKHGRIPKYIWEA